MLVPQPMRKSKSGWWSSSWCSSKDSVWHRSWSGEAVISYSGMLSGSGCQTYKWVVSILTDK
jgi:hypothetical protein